MPYRDWISGESPAASAFDALLQSQVVARFADTTDRDAVLPSGAEGGIETPTDGQLASTLDTKTLWVWNEDESEYQPLARWSDWDTYTPVLTATTTNPDLGTGATTFGKWFRQGTSATVAIFIEFGSSGASAGDGIYEISLPSACPVKSDWFGAQEIIGGNGICIDNDAGTRRAVHVKFVDADTIRLEADGLTGEVTHSNLIAWADNDTVLSSVFHYETEEAFT